MFIKILTSQVLLRVVVTNKINQLITGLSSTELLLKEKTELQKLNYVFLTQAKIFFLTFST